MDAAFVLKGKSGRMYAPKQGRWPQSAPAPKGRNSTAQGNALGKRVGINAEALKGRNPASIGPLSPFQGYRSRDGLSPQGVALGFPILPLRG